MSAASATNADDAMEDLPMLRGAPDPSQIITSSQAPDPDPLKARPGWSPVLLLAAGSTTFGCALPLGFNLGVINTPAQIISEFCNTSVSERYEVHLSDIGLNFLWSTIVSIFVIGAVLGSLSGGWVADRFGRKGAVATNNLLGLVAAILFVASFYASSVEMLLVGRLLTGISAGLTTSTMPMYLTEIASADTRGAMGCLTSLGLTVGIVLAQVLGLKAVLGQESSWHFLLACYIVPTLMSAMTLPFLPESPKYLYIIRGQEQRAIKELTRLRGGLPADLLAREVTQLKDSSATYRKDSSSFTILRLIRSRSLRLPLLIVCALQAGQTFSGINAVFFYSMIIFERAGLSHEASQYATLGAGGVNLTMAGVAVFVVNRFGRRPMAILSASMCAASLLLLSFSIVYIEAVVWMPHVCILAVLSYVVWYSLGLGPIAYFIGSELFSESSRPAAMAIGSVVTWSSNFVVGMTFPGLQAVAGGYAFLPYAVSTLLLVAFLSCYLPETRNKSPETIAETMKLRPGAARTLLVHNPSHPDGDKAASNDNEDKPRVETSRNTLFA